MWSTVVPLQGIFRNDSIRYQKYGEASRMVQGAGGRLKDVTLFLAMRLQACLIDVRGLIGTCVAIANQSQTCQSDNL